MRKTYFLASVSAILSVGIVSATFAVTLPASLKARYTGLIAALEKRDLKKYDTFYSDDYVSVDATGKSTPRKEYMAGIAALLKDATKVTLQIRYTSLKSHHGITEVGFDAKGKIVKPAGVTTFHEIGVDTWKKTGNTWIETKTVDKRFDVVETKSTSK